MVTCCFFRSSSTLKLYRIKCYHQRHSFAVKADYKSSGGRISPPPMGPTGNWASKGGELRILEGRIGQKVGLVDYKWTGRTVKIYIDAGSCFGEIFPSKKSLRGVWALNNTIQQRNVTHAVLQIMHIVHCRHKYSLSVQQKHRRHVQLNTTDKVKLTVQIKTVRQTVSGLKGCT